MEIYPMLTGSQLRQYLHISTRKLKYLMDHDYIPHEDTGQATYRYRVRWEDAVEFKRRMEEEPAFLGSWRDSSALTIRPSPGPSGSRFSSPRRRTANVFGSGWPSAGQTSRTPCPSSEQPSCWAVTPRPSTVG